MSYHHEQALTVVYTILNWSLHTHHVIGALFSLMGYFATQSFDPNNWKYVALPSLYMAIMGISEFFGFILNFELSMLVPSLLKTALSVVQVTAMFKLWYGIYTYIYV